MIHWLRKVGVTERGKRMELPEGYALEEVENGVQVLKRASGYALAAFVKGVKPENIRRVAEADKAYLEAKKLGARFRRQGDPESAFKFGGDVKEAHKRYLLALEEAYRE